MSIMCDHFKHIYKYTSSFKQSIPSDSLQMSREQLKNPGQDKQIYYEESYSYENDLNYQLSLQIQTLKSKQSSAAQIQRIPHQNQSSGYFSSEKASQNSSNHYKKQKEPSSSQTQQMTFKKGTNKTKPITKKQTKDKHPANKYLEPEDQQEFFSALSKKKATQTDATGLVIDLDTSQPSETTTNLKEGPSITDQQLNIDLIRREIKRQQKLDQQKLKRQKQQLKQLLQLQPRRINTRKLQKKQKVISKRTLELLAKKFDQYYAYQNNVEYKGPKISLRDIGLIFDIGANTIHKLYTEWMDDPTFYDRLIRYDMRKRTPQRKLTVERLEHVARLIKENPFMTQNQLCIELNKIEDLKCLKDGHRQEINKTTVARLLKVGKFRKKRVRCVPKQRNTSKSLEKRYEYCAKYKELTDKHAKIYFLDESGFNLYMTRQKAWARPNEEITVNCPISKGKRFSLIAIIGEEGLANWRIIEGTYRKYEYLDFIKQLFQKIYEMKEDPDRQKWLIMDNCAIHDKQETMKLAQKWNMKVMYLPAYSPQLNPIEMWFHQVKTKIRKINYSGERQLLQIMQRTLKEYENADFSSYYHGSLKFIEKGLRKQKF